MQEPPPNITLEWAKVIVPILLALLTAGWIGKLIGGIQQRNVTRARADQTDMQTEGLSIENEQKRLEGYMDVKDVMQQLVDSNKGYAEQLSVANENLRKAQDQLRAATLDIEALKAVIKHQQEDNRWLIEREAKLYETIAKAETHNKQLQTQLAEQGIRITELERLIEQKTEAGLRVNNEEDRLGG